MSNQAREINWFHVLNSMCSLQIFSYWVLIFKMEPAPRMGRGDVWKERKVFWNGVEEEAGEGGVIPNSFENGREVWVVGWVGLEVREGVGSGGQVQISRRSR
jgi:hypothetical protein